VHAEIPIAALLLVLVNVQHIHSQRPSTYTHQTAMACKSQLLTLGGLSAELRLEIWERYTAGVYLGGKTHKSCPNCEHLVDIMETGFTSDYTVDEYAEGRVIQPCPCSVDLVHPLLFGKVTAQQRSDLQRKAIIHQQRSAFYNARLDRRHFQHIETLILDETVFPIVDYYLDFLDAPGLKEVILPEDLGPGLGLSFTGSIPNHIEDCLANPDGPEDPHVANMLSLVKSDLSFYPWDEKFADMERRVQSGLKITSTYRYTAEVSEVLQWPFCGKNGGRRTLYKADELCGVCCSPPFPPFPSRIPKNGRIEPNVDRRGAVPEQCS
jgi:hypothetical protein